MDQCGLVDVFAITGLVPNRHPFLPAHSVSYFKDLNITSGDASGSWLARFMFPTSSKNLSLFHVKNSKSYLCREAY